MIERLDDDDWTEVFALSGEQHTKDKDPSKYAYSNDPLVASVPPGSSVDTAYFSRNDVAEIVWIEDGENDGPDWLIGGLLKDGRWFFIAAGCDYTGWDCQSGGNAYVAASREDIERFGMGDEERRRLSVHLEDGARREMSSNGWF